MKTITKQEAKKWIENAIENEIIFGLRGDWFCPKNEFKNSTNWEDGYKLKSQLNGLCAIQIQFPENIDKAFEEVKKYGDNFFIVIGDNYEFGNDNWAHEIIISNHKIYAKIIE